MYCPNCGAENKKHQHYCRYCGLHLEEVEKDFLNQLAFGAETLNYKKFKGVRKLADYLQSLAIVSALMGLLFIVFPGFITAKNLLALGVGVFILAQLVREINAHFQRKEAVKSRKMELPTQESKPELGAIETVRLSEGESVALSVTSVTEDSTKLLFVEKKKVETK